MLMFRLNPFGLLLETTPVLCQVGQKVDIKSTATTLTLMLTHPSPRFIAALQMSHEFFNLFHSDQTHHSRFSLENFYVIMYRMELQGFSSMHFSLVPQLNTAFLTFDGNSSSKYSDLYSFSSSLPNQSWFLYIQELVKNSTLWTHLIIISFLAFDFWKLADSVNLLNFFFFFFKLCLFPLDKGFK